MDEERIKAFLTDLTALTRKHGIVIRPSCSDEPILLSDLRETRYVYRHHEFDGGLEFTPLDGNSWDMWTQDCYIYGTDSAE